MLTTYSPIPKDLPIIPLRDFEILINEAIRTRDTTALSKSTISDDDTTYATYYAGNKLRSQREVTREYQIANVGTFAMFNPRLLPGADPVVRSDMMGHSPERLRWYVVQTVRQVIAEMEELDRVKALVEERVEAERRWEEAQDRAWRNEEGDD